MLYKCGSIKGYDYIYNSDDNSCKLIKHSSFYDSKKLDRGSLSLSKLKLLYGFSEVYAGLLLKICEYKINFIDYGGEWAYLLLRCINMQSCGVNVVWNCDLSDFIYNGYVMFLIIHQIHGLKFSTEFESEPQLCKVRIASENLYTCLPVPLYMLDYLIKLSRVHDFKGLDSAFAGALFTNLKKVDYSNKYLLDERVIDWSV